METVKMRREGYPHRVAFKQFYETYNGCINEFSSSKYSKEALVALCDALREMSIRHVERAGQKVSVAPAGHLRVDL